MQSHLNKILLLILLLIQPSADAMDCQLAKHLNHPSLATDDFWGKYSKIPHDRNYEIALKELIASTNPELLKASNHTVAASAKSAKEVFNLSKDAEKAKRTLNPMNQKKFDEFVAAVSEHGIEELYKNPGHWHFERFKSDRSHRTVRLHDGYRAAFTIEDGVIKITAIGNSGKAVGH